jgi:hypothetical protein
MKECLINARLAAAIDHLAKALNFDKSTDEYGFRCKECGQPLTIHQTKNPHFEHLPGHKPCALSHNKNKRPAK